MFDDSSEAYELSSSDGGSGSGSDYDSSSRPTRRRPVTNKRKSGKDEKRASKIKGSGPAKSTKNGELKKAKNQSRGTNKKKRKRPVDDDSVPEIDLTDEFVTPKPLLEQLYLMPWPTVNNLDQKVQGLDVSARQQVENELSAEDSGVLLAHRQVPRVCSLTTLGFTYAHRGTPSRRITRRNRRTPNRVRAERW